MSLVLSFLSLAQLHLLQSQQSYMVESPFGAPVVHANSLHTCKLYKSDGAILNVYGVCPVRAYLIMSWKA